MVRNNKAKYSENLWAPLDKKRFIAEKFRAKMRGICADVLLKDCEVKLRAVFVQARGIVPHGTQTL
jgi:hypothetical protein